MSMIEILISMVLLSWTMAAGYLTMIKQTAVLNHYLYQFYAKQQLCNALFNLWYAPQQFNFQHWQQALTTILPQATATSSQSHHRIQIQINWFDKAIEAKQSLQCQMVGRKAFPIAECQTPA